MQAFSYAAQNASNIPYLPSRQSVPALDQMKRRTKQTKNKVIRITVKYFQKSFPRIACHFNAANPVRLAWMKKIRLVIKVCTGGFV
jgi:hypothetical protein